MICVGDDDVALFAVSARLPSARLSERLIAELKSEPMSGVHKDTTGLSSMALSNGTIINTASHRYSTNIRP